MLYLSGEECAHLCSCLKHCAADLLHYANTTQTPISPPPNHTKQVWFIQEEGETVWIIEHVSSCVFGDIRWRLWQRCPAGNATNGTRKSQLENWAASFSATEKTGPTLPRWRLNLQMIWRQQTLMMSGSRNEVKCGVAFFFFFLPSGASATLSTFANENNQISLTGSQLSAAELDCIRAIKAKVSWTWDIDCLPSRGLEHRR